MGISGEARLLLNHIRASLIVIRVSQVEKEEVPLN
jgi:hypothetical protein